MSLWVVGAGPIEVLPDEVPRIVIFANGAVAHIPKFGNSVIKKWLMVPSNVYPHSPTALTYDSETYSAADDIAGMEEVREVIRTHSPYEKVIVRQSLGFPAHKTIDSLRKLELAPEFYALTYSGILRIISRFMSPFELYSMVIGSEKIRLESLKRLTSAKRMLSGPHSKPSTGVLAVLVALEEVGQDEELHILGITVDDASYPFESAVFPGRDRHINADLNLLLAIRKKLPEQRLFIHDKALRTATNWLDSSTAVN